MRYLAVIAISFQLLACSSMAPAVKTSSVQGEVIEAAVESEPTAEQNGKVTNEVETESTENSNPNVNSQPVDYRETIKFVNVKASINRGGSRVPLNGLYTKVTLQNNLNSSECLNQDGCISDLMNYEKSNPLYRFFFSKRVAVSASANVNVQAYSASIPLLTITEISSSEVGESWERSKVYTKGDEPLFLVPSSVTSGSLLLTFRGSEDKALSSSKALDVAIGAVGLLAPQTQLLTSLNKKSIDDKAKAIDAAIAHSFSESLVESVAVELILDSWHPDDRYDLTMNLPKDKTNWEANANQMAKVGLWTLKFEAPRVSAFYPIFVCLDGSEKQNCKDSYDNARTEVYTQFLTRSDYFRVLDSPLYQINDSDKISVGNIISGLESVQRLNDTSYIEVFSTSPIDKSKLADINLACSDIARKSSQLGLSTVDSSLIVYSTFMASSMVKVPASDWLSKLPELSSCKLAVQGLHSQKVK